MALLRLVRAWNETDHAQKMPLFVKTHAAHMVTNGIELLPAQLTHSVIHLVRDPRDTFLSFEKHMGLDRKTALKAFFDKYRTLTDDKRAKMHDFISSWALNTQSYLNADTHNVRTFRFEDMRRIPVETFSEILRHAGVDPDHDRVEAALEAVTLDKLKGQEKEVGFKEASPHHAFFGKGEVGGWKGKLHPFEERKIVDRCKGAMKLAGYIGKRAA